MVAANTYTETLNNLYGSCRSDFEAKVTDSVYNDPSVFKELVTRSGGVKKASGRRLEWNVRLGKYTTVARRAFDTSGALTTENPNTTCTASDDWATYNLAIDITNDFMKVTKGKNALYNGVDEKIDAAISEMKDRMNKDLINSTSTETNGLISIIAVLAATPTSGTIHNLSRSTYTDWRNTTTTTGGSFPTNGLNQIRSTILAASRGQGVDEPDLMFTDDTVFDYVWRLNDSRDQIILDQDQKGRRMARAMMIGNLKHTWDAAYANSTTARILNSHYFHVKVQSEANKDGVSLGEWIKPNNDVKQTSILEWQGQLCFTAFKWHAQISGWTA